MGGCDSTSAYVYKATLKVMLEQDHLKNSPDYNFSDPRLKELNEYSSQLIRHKIIPLLTELNPNLIQTISQNSQNLREVDDFLKNQAY
jgi:tRNA(Ile)-lysidine synthase TilS/MesJ